MVSLHINSLCLQKCAQRWSTLARRCLAPPICIFGECTKLKEHPHVIVVLGASFCALKLGSHFHVSSLLVIELPLQSAVLLYVSILDVSPKSRTGKRVQTLSEELNVAQDGEGLYNDDISRKIGGSFSVDDTYLSFNRDATIETHTFQSGHTDNIYFETYMYHIEVIVIQSHCPTTTLS